MLKDFTNLENRTLDIWEELLKNNISRNGIHQELEEINKKLISFKTNPTNVTIKYNISQEIINIYTFLNLSLGLDDDLKVSSIILRNQLKKPVYYILNKEAIRVYATNLSWFFTTYNETEIIVENKEYVLIKEEKMTSLAFTANMILNEDKKAIYEKYHEEHTARNFYIDISS